MGPTRFSRMVPVASREGSHFLLRSRRERRPLSPRTMPKQRPGFSLGGMRCTSKAATNANVADYSAAAWNKALLKLRIHSSRKTPVVVLLIGEVVLFQRKV